MWRDRSNLEKIIYFALNDLNKNGIVQDILKSNLLETYINKAIISKALRLDLPLNYLSKSELYQVISITNKYNDEKIEVGGFYIADYDYNIKLSYNSIIEFKDVIYSKNSLEESWVTVVTYKDLYGMMKTGKLVYNANIQMQGSLCKIDSKTIIIPRIDEKNIKKKKEAMLNKQYPANMIVFNVYNDNNDKLLYNSNDGILQIDTDIFNVAIIDGIHRISAAINALEENNELDGELILKIVNTSIKESQKFIRQEAMGKNAPNELKKFNSNNKITNVIKNINEMGSKLTNALYGRIDFEVNTPETWIVFENFEQGLVISHFVYDINKVKTNLELENIAEFIVRFFYAFYTSVKYKRINKNRKYIYNDPTFIIGLLITCHRYYKTNSINTKLMDKAVDKINYSSTEFTFDYPIYNSREKMLIRNRFHRLFEKDDRRRNLDLQTIKNKNIINVSRNSYLFQTKSKREILDKNNNTMKSFVNNSNVDIHSLYDSSAENDDIIKSILSMNIDNVENSNPNITISENKNLEIEPSMGINKSNLDRCVGKLPVEIPYHLGMLGEKYVYKLLCSKNKDFIDIIGLGNYEIDDIDWYNKLYDINFEDWDDKSIGEGHDIKVTTNGKSFYLEIKTSYSNIRYYELTRNETLANIKFKDDYYVIKILNMKYCNFNPNKINIEVIKNPIRNLNKVRKLSMYL